MKPSEKSLRLVITGRVQGVGFRDWAVREASLKRLRGFVRNRADGSVECVVIGAAPSVDAFVIACRRGPAHAKVTAVAQEPVVGVVADGFRRLETA